MTRDDLQRQLLDSFHAPAADAIDAILRLQMGGERLGFRVRHGTIDFDVADDARADATFIFADLNSARALLSGQVNPFDAFMSGRFRSDGYLLWAFALLAMFPGAAAHGGDEIIDQPA